MQRENYFCRMSPSIHHASSRPSWLPWLTLGWLVLNLLQAQFTELFHDEAYYWTWSLSPAWGYAEHPPMIAWLIGLGRLLLPGELGVRLLPVLLGTGTFYLVGRLMAPLDGPPLLWLLGGVIGLQVVGFLAVPDSPYVFFVALFMWQYRRYLQNDSWRNALLLALCITGMLYSKYHGMMVLGMVLLSHLKLLRQPKFWAIVGLVALTLLPLLAWLVEQEFATFRFHLADRMRKAPDWTFFTNYLGGQFGIVGPLLGLIILPAAFLIRPQDQFERSLQYVVLGVLAFLLLMSLRTWVEANWSAGALLPAMVLAGRFLTRRPRWQPWLWRLGIPSLLLMALLRVYLVFDFIAPLADEPVFKDEFHGWDQWAQQVQDLAKGHPVLFHHSYQYPSKYWFYTGERAYTVPGFSYHHSQYAYLGQADSLRGREVFFISESPHPPLAGYWEAKNLQRTFHYTLIEDFQSHPQVELSWTAPPVVEGDSLRSQLLMQHPYPTPLRSSEALPLGLALHVHQNGPWRIYQAPLRQRPDFSVEADTVRCSYPMEFAPGTYQVRISLTHGPFSWGVYTPWAEVEVAEP